jgi:hypothetical protein
VLGGGGGGGAAGGAYFVLGGGGGAHSGLDWNKSHSSSLRNSNIYYQWLTIIDTA